MGDRGRVPRRFSRGEVDPATPVSLWLLLTAPAEQRGLLYEYATAFCKERGNASVVEARGAPAGRACLYVVVDSGDLGGVVRGDDRAAAGLATVGAALSRLFMFEPVLVPEPAGEQTA